MVGCSFIDVILLEEHIYCHKIVNNEFIYMRAILNEKPGFFSNHGPGQIFPDNPIYYADTPI